MRILVAGADGYLGFCFSMYLANNGFDVVGVDKLIQLGPYLNPDTIVIKCV